VNDHTQKMTGGAVKCVSLQAIVSADQCAPSILSEGRDRQCPPPAWTVLAPLLLAILLCLQACGGGGGGGGGGIGFDGFAWSSPKGIRNFEITIPVPAGSTYQTSGDSVGLAGGGYVSVGGCENVQPLDVSWSSGRNGATGRGVASAYCVCIILCAPSHKWSIAFGSIPLELGKNKITVTARGSGKKKQLSLTVFREESVTSSAKSLRPGLAPPSDGHKYRRLLDDQQDADISHLHYAESAAPFSLRENQVPSLNQTLVLSDLAHYVVPTDYDFVLLYSLSDEAGWSELHGHCLSPAENIGFRNRKTANAHCSGIPEDWGELRGVAVAPIQEGQRGTTDTIVLMALHRMGQAWGVFWGHDLLEVEAGLNAGCTAATDPGGRAMTVPMSWYDEEQQGLLQSPPTAVRFNALDLYAMGLMGYEEAQSYEYLVYPHPASSTLRSISIRDVIAHLPLHGSDYFTGDGRRHPDTDASVQSLKALVVLVTAGEQAASPEQTVQLLKLARKLPTAWYEATWRRSVLSTEIHEH
jgi:hypothetical protein